MGNGGSNSRPSRNLKRQWTQGLISTSNNNNNSTHHSSKNVFARYNDKELTLLDRMFQDLARRSPAKTMSKATFLEYFSLPGFLGERLFEVFDTVGDGVIHFEEFVNGLARYNHGTLEDKISMLFEMFDMDGEQQVNREELTIILYSVITPTTALFFTPASTEVQTPENNTSPEADPKLERENSQSVSKAGLTVEQGSNKITHVSEFTRNIVCKLVDEAFEQCDTNRDGKLSQEQFAYWVEQNPSTLRLLETVFAKHLWSGWETEQCIDNVSVVSSPMDDEEPEQKLYHLDSKRSQSYRNSLHNVAFLPKVGNKSPRRASSTHLALDGYKFDKPLSHIPQYFRPLYETLSKQYLEDSTIENHVIYICNDCKFIFCTSLFEECEEDGCSNVGNGNGLNSSPKKNSNMTQFLVIKKNGNKDLRLRFCAECGQELMERHVRHQSYAEHACFNLDLESAVNLMPLSTGVNNIISKEGLLYKIGKQTKIWVGRYYVIKEKFLYTFKKQNESNPTSVLFISGWFISALKDHHTTKNYFGLELTPPHANSYDSTQSKILYTKSAAERDDWLHCLQIAASTVSIETHYKIGKTLGKGHFSVVHMGTHIETKKKYAIKVVEKKRIDAREKMSLRNEIAIMKLVNHPCIIHMEDVYEDKKCIYMVMSLVKHGDFFERWKSKKRFDESVVRILIWKLLDAIHYLHSLGIVHRDLKPENILCLSETDDTKIVISDFGLSKFAAPHTEMTMPCGTLAYVAPEVLSMKGYGRNVDLWSLGCIMHLLLRGVLPFDGHSKDEVIERTLNKELNLSGPKWEHVSDEAKDLLFKLLIKNPSKRINVKGAIEHTFFAPLKLEDNYLAVHTGISATLKGVLNSGYDSSKELSPVHSENEIYVDSKVSGELVILNDEIDENGDNDEIGENGENDVNVANSDVVCNSEGELN